MINPDSIMAQLTSKAQSLGVFERVNGHEPKNAPGSGLSAAFWLQRIQPVAQLSGLNSTATVIVFMMRAYSNMQPGSAPESQDQIDPNLIAAMDRYINELTNDYTLGGTVHAIDLLRQTQFIFEAQAGYVSIDQTMYRVLDLTIPVILTDVWSQEA